jgi:hypothetical protein
MTIPSSVLRGFLILAAFGTLLLTSGCTSRGMTITSEPPGAEVSINRRVVGTTPIRVGYTHYGTYRIELRKFGYEVLVREEPLKPPIYGFDPPAAVADNLIPARLDDEVYLHYVLKLHGPKADKAESSADQTEPVEVTGEKTTVDTAAANKTALLDRATKARGGTVTHPRTGETIQVAIGPELNKKSKAAPQPDEQVTIAETYTTIGPTLTPNLEIPTVLAPVRMIDAPQPKGPTLAKEYGIVSDTPGEGTAAFVKPDEAKKPVTPAVVRTPKDEELIYDQPKMSDPTAKKK